MNPYRDTVRETSPPKTSVSPRLIVALVLILVALLFNVYRVIDAVGVTGAVAAYGFIAIVGGFSLWWRSPKQVARRRARVEAKAEKLIAELDR